MEHENTSMEVEGAKGASTLASASDATATGTAMSRLAADVPRAESRRGTARRAVAQAVTPGLDHRLRRIRPEVLQQSLGGDLVRTGRQ